MVVRHFCGTIGALSLGLGIAAPLSASAQPPVCPKPPSTATESGEHSSEHSNVLLAVRDWMIFPEIAVSEILQNMGETFIAQAEVAPWPAIHERSRRMRVPILMYHDILAEKEVFFDVTPEELEAHFQAIRELGVTPISLDRVVEHLQTGRPLPPKPVVLTFDDGYVGHYEYVYPLLQEYNFPAVFSVFPGKVNGDVVGRSTLTWEQLHEMKDDPLITIAAHSVTHPPDLRELPDSQLQREILESKHVLERELDISIRYFTYPEGKYDARVSAWVMAAGYDAALTMNDEEDRYSGESLSLMAIDRIGQSSIDIALEEAWGGEQRQRRRRIGSRGFDFNASIDKQEVEIDGIPLVLISGGKPITIHADSRYQVPEILEGTEAIAAVDGGFFNMEFLDSNHMIGPVFSQSTGEFIPGDGQNQKLRTRPLVLIGETSVKFIPFDPDKHNTLDGIQAEMPDVTDAFVGAAMLVKDDRPQPTESFGTLFDFDATRHRAFWGIDRDGKPVIGVSAAPVDSVWLGEILAEAGLRDAVMLDSGASTSLAYRGESLVGYVPRPVPHVVALLPPEADAASRCVVATTDGEPITVDW